MNKILTIIIPTYNMEKYLQKCLDSLIIKDTELFNKLEVLIINDGSKDSSSEIGHQFQQKYPEVFKVIDKENGNYGSCINRGLKEGKGKYIKILDADDSFHNEGFSDYLNELTRIDADLVLSDYSVVDEKGNITKEVFYEYPKTQIVPIEKLFQYDSFFHIQMHGTTYKTENLKIIGYKQSEGISYTDQEWMFYPMTTVKTVYCSKERVYKYLLGREGQTMDKKILLKNIDHTIKGTMAMLDIFLNQFAENNSMYNRYLEERLMTRLKYIYKQCLLHKGLESEEFLSLEKTLINCPNLYKKIEDETTNIRSKPYPYIKKWRENNHKKPFLLRLTIEYRAIKNEYLKYS